MSTYTPQHGDIYLLDDRKQAGFSLSGTNYTLNPNVWMMSNGAISKGWLVASVTGSNNLVTLADKDSVTSILGIALNTVNSTAPVTKTCTVVQNSDTFSVASTTGLVAGMMITGASVPSNTFILNVINSTHIQMTRNYPGTGGSFSLVIGNAVEVLTCGMVQYTSKVFNLSDVGQTVYPSPEAASNFLNPGTIGSHPQLTISRSYASTSGNPLMEVGIIISETELLVDLNGDARGATGLTQVTALAGENISNNGTPLVISLGTDGQIYLADRRKSANGTTAQRNNPIGFLVGANTGYQSSGTITSGTACVIQKLGTISGFTGLTPGKPVYADISGGSTQNAASLSYYTDVATPIGVAATSTTLFVTVGFNSQTSDSNPIGSIVALNTAGVADFGYLLANGATMNIAAPTVNPSGQVVGTYDGTSLYNVIGTTFGGTAQFTVTVSGGTPTVGQTLYVNGVEIAITGTTAAAIATQLAGLSQTGYTFASVSSGIFSVANDSTHSPVNIVLGTLQYTTISVSGGTYLLPSLNSGNPKFQIRYLNFYMANPPQAPLFRYDTGWTTWGNVPNGSSSLNPTSYLDVPITGFGANPPVTDLFAEVYVSKGTVTRKIESAPIIYTQVTTSASYYRYGYQMKSDSGTPGSIRIEFGSDGLAYFDINASTYVPIDSTWTFRILIYKTERFNKYYDYTMDQKGQQLWSLGLVDYTAPSTSQNASIGGYFDRSSSAPAHTTRLNYDGNLYTTNEFITNGITVGGLATINDGATVSNTTVSHTSLNVQAPAGQTAAIASIGKSGVGFPYFVITKDGYIGISNTTANTPLGLFDIHGSSGTIRFSLASDTISFVRDGESKITVGNSGISSLSLQINGTTAININNEGDVGFFDNPSIAIASGTEKVIELRSADNVTGSSLHLYSHDSVSIQGIITSNANGVYIDSAAATTTKSIDLRVGGSSSLYINQSKNIVIGTSSSITSPSANTTSKIIDIRSENNTDGAIVYLNSANGSSAKTMLSSQTTGFILDSLSTAQSIDLRINGSSSLLIDSNKYINVSTRLGIGGTPTNIFQVFTGSTTTNGAIFSSIGTVRSISIFPRNAAGANNDLVATNDTSIIYSNTLVVGPSIATGANKGFRMDGNGNMAVWGTTTFNSAGTAVNQQVEVGSGYLKINAAGAGTSASKFSVASNTGVSKGDFGGYFSAPSTLGYFYIGTDPVTNTEFKLSYTTGNGTFYGTCTATAFLGNLGTSGSHVSQAYVTNATIDASTQGVSTISEANITSLRGGKIGWNPASGGSVSEIAEAYITSLGMDTNYVTSAYITNAHVTHLILNSGTTTVAPIVFTTGSLLTSITNGAVEYQADNFYMSTNGNRYSVALATPDNQLRFVTSADSILTLPSGTANIPTDAIATSSSAGLLPSLPGDEGQYLRGDGTWANFADSTGIQDGNLTLNFVLGGTVVANTSFSANQGTDASFDVELAASVSTTNNSIAIRTSTGGLNATYFNATSARALKENISPFTENAVDIINATNVVSFNFRADEEKTFKIGFIADDTNEYMATKAHDQMDISNTLGLLLKAVQELSAENQELKRRLDFLTARY